MFHPWGQAEAWEVTAGTVKVGEDSGWGVLLGGADGRWRIELEKAKSQNKGSSERKRQHGSSGGAEFAFFQVKMAWGDG
jgi:hypothetical protein